MTRRIKFQKHDHRYVLTYTDGASDRVIDQLAEWAGDETHPLDWHDAAFISFAMGRREDLEMDVVTEKVYAELTR